MTGRKHDGALRRREEGRYEKESKRAADLEAENVRLASEVAHLKKEVKSSNEKADFIQDMKPKKIRSWDQRHFRKNLAAGSTINPYLGPTSL